MFIFVVRFTMSHKMNRKYRVVRLALIILFFLSHKFCHIAQTWQHDRHSTVLSDQNLQEPSLKRQDRRLGFGLQAYGPKLHAVSHCSYVLKACKCVEHKINILSSDWALVFSCCYYTAARWSDSYQCSPQDFMRLRWVALGPSNGGL